MLSKPTRLRFDSVKRTDDEQTKQFDVTVRLSFGDKICQGSCYGYMGESDELELAASAALQAVAEFVQHRFECQTLELDLVSALGKDLVVLLINVCFDGRELQIFGSCVAEGNLLEASARASLDATNRFVDLTLVSEGQANSSLNIAPSSGFPC